MKVAQAGMNLLQKAMARPDPGPQGARHGPQPGLARRVGKGPQPPSVALAPGLQRRRARGWRWTRARPVSGWWATGWPAPGLIAPITPSIWPCRICWPPGCLKGVEDWQAAYTTLAAIALHAARQTGAGLGERGARAGAGVDRFAVDQHPGRPGRARDGRRHRAGPAPAERAAGRGMSPSIRPPRIWRPPRATGPRDAGWTLWWCAPPQRTTGWWNRPPRSCGTGAG